MTAWANVIAVTMGKRRLLDIQSELKKIAQLVIGWTYPVCVREM